MTEGLSAGEAMMIGNGGGSWAWIVILLLAFNGGFGGRGYDSNVARIQDVYASNDLQSIRSAINNLGNGIADATFALNNNILSQSNLLQRDVLNGFNQTQVGGLQNTYAVTGAVEGVKDAVKDCCSTTQRNVDTLRYDAAQQTSIITANDTSNTQKILDKLNSMEMNAKDAKIQELTALLGRAELGISQRDQNAFIIGTLAPKTPVPAYQVANPYTAYNGSGCPCVAY